MRTFRVSSPSLLHSCRSLELTLLCAARSHQVTSSSCSSTTRGCSRYVSRPPHSTGRAVTLCPTCMLTGPVFPLLCAPGTAPVLQLPRHPAARPRGLRLGLGPLAQAVGSVVAHPPRTHLPISTLSVFWASWGSSRRRLAGRRLLYHSLCMREAVPSAARPTAHASPPRRAQTGSHFQSNCEAIPQTVVVSVGRARRVVAYELPDPLEPGDLVV